MHLVDVEDLLTLTLASYPAVFRGRVFGGISRHHGCHQHGVCLHRNMPDSPVAAGSGIPEIKCYLNGVKIPRVARFKSLIAKAVGVLFSVAGGLFVGKEGPMIHSGAIIGAGIPQFQSITFKKIKSKFDFFRTDSCIWGPDWRRVILPGRGMLILEPETHVENVCVFHGRHLYAQLFPQWCADENKTNGTCRLWTALDLFIFVLMGLIGGLLGALFNQLNKILESLLVAMVTTTVAFVASMMLGRCKPIPSIMTNTTSSAIEEDVRTYFCEEGSYNDMATLFFNSQEEAIKQLFHQPGEFDLSTLALFFVFFFLLACWTYGVAVPSGLFVPSLLCGAAYGRFVATLLVNVIGYDRGIYLGTFSLIGAAAFLGGVVRMTISLTVILIESTNEISYGLPLMLTLMVAKWCGDFFNEGLYDIHIHLKGVPLLEWDVPEGMHRLTAKNAMCSDLHFLFPRTRVSVLHRILKTTAHNAYPVVSVVDRAEVSDLADISVNVCHYNLLSYMVSHPHPIQTVFPRAVPFYFPNIRIYDNLLIIGQRFRYDF
ncbi:CLCN6-like protein [Mya arenaria]|uniref:CLCN6-like protein n=1 Tax=Mya arenaria TaxID=6604 RepID=A0ABY7F7P1_MYAAR|nr:CLCN6-like protein [Mya arenaria]